MNLDHLRELDEIFEHHGDALILVCLSLGVAAEGGRPLHFREVARTIIEQTGSYMGDGSLTRVLPRLKRGGLVAVDDERARHPSYSLTPLGREKANLLIFVLETLDNRDNPQ